MSILDFSTEIFARGFAFTRSFTHPYLVKRVGPLWVLRDGPRKGGDQRTEEWIACGTPPGEVHKIVREQVRGRFAISAIQGIDQPDVELRAVFRDLGYRLRTTEAFMVHDLRRVPRCNAPEGVVIEQVMAQTLADRLARAARSRQILPEHFCEGALLRQYVALAGERPVGWVRSIVVHGSGRDEQATWCSNMHVVPEFRRQGIGRAMLCRMLRDDRAHGSKIAVLLASHAGAKLYPVVGYKQIGTLFLFSPRK